MKTLFAVGVALSLIATPASAISNGLKWARSFQIEVIQRSIDTEGLYDCNDPDSCENMVYKSLKDARRIVKWMDDNPAPSCIGESVKVIRRGFEMQLDGYEMAVAPGASVAGAKFANQGLDKVKDGVLKMVEEEKGCLQ